MSKWGMPQLFAMWRRSVLFTVGAISLGAEELENQLGRLLKKNEGQTGAPRVKVPVRAGRVTTARPVQARKVATRSARKAAVKAPKATTRTVRRVKAEAAPIAPVTVTESTNAH